MNNQGSLYGSSVRSYQNLDLLSKPYLVKYLHTQEKIAPESPHREYTPLLPRNKSYDNFTSKLLDRPSRDPAPALPQRFYESIENSSSQQKYIGEIAGLQNEITKLMANEVSIMTEKDLLVKEGRRLREEIEYLNQKCSSLQAKNEQLFKSQSKMAILERQYNKVLVEFQSFKSHCRIMHDPSAIQYLTNLPTKVEQNYEIEDDHYRMKQREASRMIPQPQTNKFSGKVSQKVSWKKTSAAISPIHKLEHYRKYSGNRFDDLSLIESKIDKAREEEQAEQRADYYEHNFPSKTIELKALDKLREYDLNVRAIQLQVKELRSKNMSLYKRSEQGEREKMKLLETINQLSYEKSKLQTEHKSRENELRREIEKVRLDFQEKKIKIMELNESIESLTQAKKLALLERAEIQQKLKVKNYKESKTANEHNKSIAQLKLTLEKTEMQFIALKERLVSLNKRQEQLQIQNKLHIHELEEKKTKIAKLEAQLQKLKELRYSQPHAILEEQSVLSKTENKIQIKPVPPKEQRSNVKLVQTEPDSNLVKISEQLASLKDLHQRLMNEHSIWGFQLNKLKSQNHFLNENYLKLCSLYEHSKFDSQKLKQLIDEWRAIEAKMRNMKHIDLTVDHLWQIKEVQYQNLHLALSNLNKSVK